MKAFKIPSITLQNIAKDYINGLRGDALVKKYPYSGSKIYKSLREVGVCIRDHSRRKHLINEKMFETIDMEWKAYLLGLLYADGSVSRLNITLRLHQKDKHIMEDLTKILSVPLVYTPPKKYYYESYERSMNGQYYFNINSKKVVSDIISLGCTSKKSLTLTFPSYELIPKNLFNHFIRGYFDGDGWITSNTFGIIGSDAFCIGFQKWLMESMSIPSYLKKCKKVSRVLIHRQEDRIKLYDFLYKNATLYLNRKRDNFVNHKIIGYCLRVS